MHKPHSTPPRHVRIRSPESPRAHRKASQTKPVHTCVHMNTTGIYDIFMYIELKTSLQETDKHKWHVWKGNAHWNKLNMHTNETSDVTRCEDVAHFAQRWGCSDCPRPLSPNLTLWRGVGHQAARIVSLSSHRWQESEWLHLQARQKNVHAKGRLTDLKT